LEMLKLFKENPVAALDKCKQLVIEYMGRDECHKLSKVYTSMMHVRHDHEEDLSNLPRTKKEKKRILRKEKSLQKELGKSVIQF